ncbi:MAG: hypothetical protein HY281_00955 [Nitrospirae bacterium]|nr:hypothetical protein [Nitrospirota bacterium]
MITVCLLTQFSFAGGGEHRTLQLLLNKGIITQQEYDQAVQEEERVKVEEEQRVKVEGEQRAKVEEEKRAKQGSFFTRNGLQVRLGGFAEFNFIDDNTRSFQELVGNRPVLHSNTVGGANSQFYPSPRNSRIILDVRAPEQDGIKSRLFLSMDFLGNQPAVGTSTVTEFSQMTSPNLRIFQLFFLAETPVVDVKVGQDWSRFGFMSQYSRGQVSTAVTPANMFNRWIQASLSKQLQVTESLSLTPVLSVERPPQADATLPSFVAGVQIAHSGLKAPYNGAQAAETSLRSLSVQVSGVGRRLEANSGGPTSSTGLSSQTYVTGWGVSTSLFLPVLPSKNGEIGNTAHVVMEGVTGAGIADFFNGLSWGVCSPVCGNATGTGFGGNAFGQTNIDSGLAAVSSKTGTFEAIRTTSMMVHGTYYLPDNGKTWVGGGYGTVYSSNANQMTCGTVAADASSCGGAVRTLHGIYNRESTYYGYLYHDFTQEIRMGLETNFTRTGYADGSNAENRRVMMSLYYRF